MEGILSKVANETGGNNRIIFDGYMPVCEMFNIIVIDSLATELQITYLCSINNKIWVEGWVAIYYYTFSINFIQ